MKTYPTLTELHAMTELYAIRQRSVQAIGAGLSRRDWGMTETAYNELRDRLDNLIRTVELNNEARNTTTQSDR